MACSKVWQNRSNGLQIQSWMFSAHVTPAMSSGPVLRLRDETEKKTGQKADLMISINHPLKSV